MIGKGEVRIFLAKRIMKGDDMDTRMNRRWIALVLIGIVAIGANPESTSEIIRRLEAEVRLLRAQVHSLKKKLADQQPVVATRPTSQPTKPKAPKGGKTSAYEFTVYETNPKWWTDARSFQDEIDTRNQLQRFQPQQSPEAWAARHNHFVGKDVQWSLVITDIDRISKDTAAAKYISTDRARARLADSIARLGRTAHASHIVAQEQLKLWRVQSELARWKMLMKNGGAVLELSLPGRSRISVTIAVRALLSKHLKEGGRYTVKGRIDSAGTRRDRFAFGVAIAP